jgi:hypothetical protein
MIPALEPCAKNYIRLSLVFGLYLIVSSFVLLAFMEKWELSTDDPNFGFLDAINHTSKKPWAYRVLSPATINLISAILPVSAKQEVAEFLAARSSRLLKYPKILNNPSWTAEVYFKYQLMYLSLFVSLFAVLVVFRSLTRAILGHDGFLPDVAPAMGLLFLPLTFYQGGYYYDFPELMFMGLVLMLMLKRKWVLYHFVFALSILNKESNVLLVMFYIVMMYKAISDKEFCLHLLLQGVIGMVTFGATRFIFWDSPGMAVEHHFYRNLDYLLTPQNYISFTGIYAPMVPVPTPSNLLLVIFLVALIYYGWKKTPIRIRTLFLISSAVNIPLVLLFGWVEEARNYSFMFPALYFIAVCSVVGLYGDDADGEESIQVNSSISCSGEP